MHNSLFYNGIHMTVASVYKLVQFQRCIMNNYQEYTIYLVENEKGKSTFVKLSQKFIKIANNSFRHFFTQAFRFCNDRAASRVAVTACNATHRMSLR